MSIPEKHHFLPEFYLSYWTDKENMLFRWSYPYQQKLDVQRRSPGAVGFQRNLYSIESDTAEKQQSVETDIMTKVIDTPAALALQYFLQHGVKDLPEAHRVTWTRFMQSLKFRIPTVVNQLKTKTPEALLKVLDETQPEYEEIRNSSENIDMLPEKAADFVKARMPNYLENSGIGIMLKTMSSPNPSIFISYLNWGIATLASHVKKNFITGDHVPLILGEMYGANCTIIMPISPRKLFIACADENILRKIKKANLESGGRLVLQVNALIAANAYEAVYSFDKKDKELIIKNFTGTREVPELVKF